MRRWLVLGAAFAVLGASAGVGCAQTTCDDLGTCAGATSAQDGGPDAPGIDAPLDAPGTLDAPADAIVRPDGGPCDATKRPNEDGCQPIDGSGLFVAPSPKGDDSTGTGTKAKPFASIGGAVAKATGATRIYVCEGTYGALSLDAKASGPITVFGGLSCATWAFTGGKTRLAPAQEGPALRMVGVTAKVELADLAFEAMAATTPETTGEGKSSIAAFVSTSQDVTFRRATLTAHAGAPGANGAPPTEYTAAAPIGFPGMGAAPGAAKTNTCANGLPSSTGGAGGAPGGDGQNGAPSGLPVYPAGFTGGGSTSLACIASGAGGTSASFGPGGTAGAGATKSGTLAVTGWLPASGSAGMNGGTAQGGGGAGGSAASAGGGGGPGGCGGVGGARGAGGGASVALLIFKSTVALRSTLLNAGAGGEGGDGAAGQKGQLAETNRASGSCSGGLGGVGGSGGGGGGGAGGVSLGIGYVGTAPMIDGALVSDVATLPGVVVGPKGGGGAKGSGGAAADTVTPSKSGDTGTSGTDGAAQAVLALPE